MSKKARAGEGLAAIKTPLGMAIFRTCLRFFVVFLLAMLLMSLMIFYRVHHN